MQDAVLGGSGSSSRAGRNGPKPLAQAGRSLHSIDVQMSFEGSGFCGLGVSGLVFRFEGLGLRA